MKRWKMRSLKNNPVIIINLKKCRIESKKWYYSPKKKTDSGNMKGNI